MLTYPSDTDEHDGDFCPRICQIMCRIVQPQVLTWGSGETYPTRRDTANGKGRPSPGMKLSAVISNAKVDPQDDTFSGHVGCVWVTHRLKLSLVMSDAFG